MTAREKKLQTLLERVLDDATGRAEDYVVVRGFGFKKPNAKRVWPIRSSLHREILKEIRYKAKKGDE